MADARRGWLTLPARLGLRARITFAFAATTAVLSALMAGTTWGLTRENLINQREAAATRQARQNAAIVATQVEADDSDEPVREALRNLDTPTSARPIIEVREGDEWRTVPLQPTVGADAIPEALRAAVADGEAARMLVDIDGDPELVIGVPIDETAAAYYEVVSFRELQDTLRSLAVSLFGASVITTLVGGALGYWLSRRTLRPLANVGLAAEAIAGGRLDTRLEGTEDPDLNVLVSSFNHMAQALEERIDRDGRFASDVSHELRSPLMTLAASVSVLGSRRDEMPDEASRSAVDLMEADVARFQQLVDDLLEISRFDAGVARLSLEEVRLPELVRQAVSQRRDDDPPAVEIDADLAGMLVRADKRRLVRILDNLLGNADAYGDGAERVALEAAGDSVLIVVEDGGPGVAEEDRARIFDRFSRGAGAGRRSAGGDGVGLGLALVAEHARLHGGRAWVEDRPDGKPGARFVVQLPVARVRPSPAPRLAAVAVGVGLLLAALVGCGIPTDDAPRAIADATTTAPVDPTAPPGTGATADILLSRADLSGQLVRVERTLDGPATPARVLDALLAAPSEEDTNRGYTTQIPADTTAVSVVVDEDLVTVEMSEEWEALGGGAATAAYAQVVLTLTDLPVIERVRFLEADGDEIPAPTPSEGNKVVVTGTDYAALAPEDG